MRKEMLPPSVNGDRILQCKSYRRASVQRHLVAATLQWLWCCGDSRVLWRRMVVSDDDAGARSYCCWSLSPAKTSTQAVTVAALGTPSLSTFRTLHYHNHNGDVAAAGRGSGASARRCARRGAPADYAHAPLPRNARQADGCAQVQVLYSRIYRYYLY